MPIIAHRDARALLVFLLASAAVADGLEPALRGLGADRVVRWAGLLGGWLSAFAALLVLGSLGYLLLRSVLVSTASLARSVLTGSTAVAVALAVTMLVGGRAGGAAYVLIGAVVAALVASRAIVRGGFGFGLEAGAAIAFGLSTYLASQAFETSGLVLWAGARAAATLAWLLVLLQVGGLAQRVGRGSRAALLLALSGAVALFLLAGAGRSASDASIAALAHRALTQGPVSVVPFSLGGLPHMLPSAARILGWAAVFALPASGFGGVFVAVFLCDLPAPLAALAILFACQLDASGCDDARAEK